MPYLSEESIKTLQAELKDRKYVKRREIAERISAARELGDLSENFEYHEAKDQQGANEVRIVVLEDMLKTATVIHVQTGKETISLGGTFTAKTEKGSVTYRIVGATEANPLAGSISNESPLGQAFLGHRVGEVVTVTTPAGIMSYTIVSIE